MWENFLSCGLALAVVVGMVVRYRTTERLGDLGDIELRTHAHDLVWNLRTAPGPGALIRPIHWIEQSGLTHAQMLQVQRYAAKQGWIQFVSPLFLDMIARVAVGEVRLTNQGYDMIQRGYAIPATASSITISGHAVGNTFGNANVVTQTNNFTGQWQSENIDWQGLVEALRSDLPSLPPYDRVGAEQVLADLTDSGAEGPEASRGQAIVSWLTDQVVRPTVSELGAGLWASTTEWLRSNIGLS